MEQTGLRRHQPPSAQQAIPRRRLRRSSLPAVHPVTRMRDETDATTNRHRRSPLNDWSGHRKSSVVLKQSREAQRLLAPGHRCENQQMISDRRDLRQNRSNNTMPSLALVDVVDVRQARLRTGLIRRAPLRLHCTSAIGAVAGASRCHQLEQTLKCRRGGSIGRLVSSLGATEAGGIGVTLPAVRSG